jgi:hypothetical protein
MRTMTEEKVVTREQAKSFVENYNGSRIFTVTFIKRTTGETRVMNCRKGVKKFLKGGELKFSPKNKGLVVVHDMQKNEPRMIALESIQSIKHNGVEYIVR